MVPITQLTGRLGNQMFQYAALYKFTKDAGIEPEMRLPFFPNCFQDPKYFEGYEDDIKKMFGIGIEPNDYIGIHVRRGDYVGNSFYTDLTQTDYYQKAMEQFSGEKFLVFSDDIEWCRQQEQFEECDFSVGNDEISDMNVMAGCKGIIVANSSYSWFAAYLGSESKTVICPQESRWFADGITRTKCPDHWIKI